MFYMVLEWMGCLVDEWFLIFDDCNLSECVGFILGRGKGNIIYILCFNGFEYNFLVYFVYYVEFLVERDVVEFFLGVFGFLDVIFDLDKVGFMVLI